MTGANGWHRRGRGGPAFGRAIALLVAIAWLAAGCSKGSGGETVEAFLERHWRDPLPAQGTPPRSYSPNEVSLAPRDCGGCHPQQFRDWQQSLHSRSMGAGIRWQFEKLGQAQSNGCLKCHAPLAEQKALLALEMGWAQAPASPRPEYVPAQLAHEGLACAACHVRSHVRYGPPSPSAAPRSAPHGGFVGAQAFRDSLFCAACHQFPQDGPRLGGELRENTHEQWKASRFAPDRSCQSCHMPGGRHLWRGVHDPQMVRDALKVELRLAPLAGGDYQAEVIASNVGAGHHLPTYLVAKIALVLTLQPRGGPQVEIARDVIGWQADLGLREVAFDTRIPAGGSRRYLHRFSAPHGPWQATVSVEVAPGEHYERMFRYSQRHVELSGAAHALLARAIEEKESVRFTAFRVSATP